MKDYSLVVQRFPSHFSKAFLAGAETSEVFARYGTNIGKQLEYYPAHRQSADLDVKEYSRIDVSHGCLWPEKRLELV